MKKYILLFCLTVITSVSALAQLTLRPWSGGSTPASPDYAAGKGTWIVALGWEGGFYFNDIKTNIFGYDSTYSDTAGAVFFPIAVEYCFSNRISAGLQYKRGRYIEDNAYESNKTGVFDFYANFHLLMKKKNDLYLHLGLGFAGLHIERTSAPRSTGDWTGSHVGLGLGYRHFFTEHIGFYTSFGKSAYSLKQKSLTSENVTIDPADLSWDLDLRGWEFSIGLTGRF